MIDLDALLAGLDLERRNFLGFRLSTRTEVERVVPPVRICQITEIQAWRGFACPSGKPA